MISWMVWNAAADVSSIDCGVYWLQTDIRRANRCTHPSVKYPERSRLDVRRPRASLAEWSKTSGAAPIRRRWAPAPNRRNGAIRRRTRPDPVRCAPGLRTRWLERHPLIRRWRLWNVSVRPHRRDRLPPQWKVCTCRVTTAISCAVWRPSTTTATPTSTALTATSLRLWWIASPPSPRPLPPELLPDIRCCSIRFRRRVRMIRPRAKRSALKMF